VLLVPGGMDLDIVINHSVERIHIREGEYFLLHAGIPHSPQRYPNSVGIVFERERSANELDCMRWYKSNGVDVEYEEFFHCKDLGSQIKQVIENFNNFTANSSGIMWQQPPYSSSMDRMKSDLLNLRNDKLLVSNPRYLNEEIVEFMADNSEKCRTLIDSEFRLSLLKPQHPHILSDELRIIKERVNQSNHTNTVFLWQLQGNTNLNFTNNGITLGTDEVIMVNLKDIIELKPEQIHKNANRDNCCLMILSNRCA